MLICCNNNMLSHTHTHTHSHTFSHTHTCPQGFDVKVDEAAMTGEGEVVKKSFEKDPMLYAGTQVRSGRGGEEAGSTVAHCVCECVSV